MRAPLASVVLPADQQAVAQCPAPKLAAKIVHLKNQLGVPPSVGQAYALIERAAAGVVEAAGGSETLSADGIAVTTHLCQLATALLARADAAGLVAGRQPPALAAAAVASVADAALKERAALRLAATPRGLPMPTYSGRAWAAQRNAAACAAVGIRPGKAFRARLNEMTGVLLKAAAALPWSAVVDAGNVASFASDILTYAPTT